MNDDHASAARLRELGASDEVPNAQPRGAEIVPGFQTYTDIAETSSQRAFFPNWRRLRSIRDFDRVYEGKQRAGNDVLLIFAACNNVGRTRIGLSVSRKHGNSVVRHRLRRLLKEAYRLEQQQIPEGLDLVLIPGRLSATATLSNYRESLVSLAHKLNERLRRAFS